MINLLPHVGRRVRYLKPGNHGRNGWVGTLIGVEPGERGLIQWDQLPMGDATSYCNDAFAFPNELQFSEDAPTGYIHFTDTVERTLNLYLVAGSNGGPVHRVYGYDHAVELATQKAQKSKSGQAYLLFTATESFQRAQPPIERITLQ